MTEMCFALADQGADMQLIQDSTFCGILTNCFARGNCETEEVVCLRLTVPITVRCPTARGQQYGGTVC